MVRQSQRFSPLASSSAPIVRLRNGRHEQAQGSPLGPFLTNGSAGHSPMTTFQRISMPLREAWQYRSGVERNRMAKPTGHHHTRRCKLQNRENSKILVWSPLGPAGMVVSPEAPYCVGSAKTHSACSNQGPPSTLSTRDSAGAGRLALMLAELQLLTIAGPGRTSPKLPTGKFGQPPLTTLSRLPSAAT